MYSRVEHFARTVWLGRFGWNNRMAMYSAYFDESGHRKNGGWFVVAGFLGDVAQLVHLEREWSSILTPYGISRFHAADFNKGSTGFGHLTENDRDEIHGKLVGAILRRIEIPIAWGVDLSKYNAANSKYLIEESLGSPYGLAARSCIGACENWISHNSITDPVEIIFENGATDSGQVEWICIRDSIPVPLFKDKRDFSPLEAADLLAYCAYQSRVQSRLKRRHEHALKRLQDEKGWQLSTPRLDDPDLLATICDVGLRSPQHRYKNLIIRNHGSRVACTQRWPRAINQPKLSRETLNLPVVEPISPEEWDRREREYRDRGKKPEAPD